jgi:hypothetical protein
MVSDEFTVPLCAIHHQQNHATGNERSWWQEHKIDPLAVATRLWGKASTCQHQTTNPSMGVPLNRFLRQVRVKNALDLMRSLLG